MKTYTVHNATAVVILNKAEARALLVGVKSGYMQNTKTKARIIQAIEDALDEVGALVRPVEVADGDSKS